MLPLRLLTALAAFTSVSTLFAAVHSVSSPDSRLAVTLSTDDGLSLSAALDGKTVITPTPVRLHLIGGRDLGADASTATISRRSHDSTVRPVVKRKFAELADHYHELTVDLGDHALEIRVLNDGFGYRFTTAIDGEVLVRDESLALSFPRGTRSLFPEEESIMSHNERLYLDVDLADVSADRFASTPVLFTTPDGVRVVFSDADLYNYPGLFLSGTGGPALTAKLPPYPLTIEPADNGTSDRNVVLTETADYVARSDGHRTYPWRAYIVSDDDRDLLASELIFLLSRENEIADPSWIKPGTVAWDWYNANNITGVDFEAGINNATYKFYIDFASRYGINYVILDEGWSASTTNLFEPNPDIDVPELVAYGAERGVDIILWSLNEPLAKDREALFDLYASWGVKGVKIDFMQRNDQPMVEFYHETARAAAERHLLVDYHGSFKPSGLRRAYPNVISYEGVKGNENNKWSSDITPTHNVTLPFIRMAVGPMDYTPGAMVNTHLRDHRVSHFRPMGIGTRAHEIAKYVVFESPLQMYCDSPSLYLKEAESIAFMTRIPTVWDETKPLHASVGHYAVIARRSGDTWFIGAMTDEEPRDIEVDLSFLGAGDYTATILRDGVNAHQHAEDYRREERTVDATTTLKLQLSGGGGWTAILEPVH
ncbi:glycoside hydrolase family 97 protein [Actomonas aquatica]|uniref:Glycoside hydrolase family 97 protein n=1 Tax=Actomonas aquatica TaxID=2866162 RepID=A0ABZ1C9N3_9BACT|nr:glycoside hydrolase family 97 protein [Opitutus sp. WL0086]WRQ87938.1 glycoside hydrolase family 97 protein [Opitutus sp. WL0086]